jgi:hypothetical protein
LHKVLHFLGPTILQSAGDTLLHGQLQCSIQICLATKADYRTSRSEFKPDSSCAVCSNLSYPLKTHTHYM